MSACRDGRGLDRFRRDRAGNRDANRAMKNHRRIELAGAPRAARAERCAKVATQTRGARKCPCRLAVLTRDCARDLRSRRKFATQDRDASQPRPLS
ncbi:hypothetical protein [Lysobacter gummosus]|uniref:hypothetical protein n=1 Tax=Lysobacter gummosus TaxID=262324 RepID=UPI003627DDF1